MTTYHSIEGQSSWIQSNRKQFMFNDLIISQWMYGFYDPLSESWFLYKAPVFLQECKEVKTIPVTNSSLEKLYDVKITQLYSWCIEIIHLRFYENFWSMAVWWMFCYMTMVWIAIDIYNTCIFSSICECSDHTENIVCYKMILFVTRYRYCIHKYS